MQKGRKGELTVHEILKKGPPSTRERGKQYIVGEV